MGLIKICPVCNEKNEITQMNCSKCNNNIADISPVDENDLNNLRVKVEKEDAETIVFSCMNKKFEIESGDIIGRKGVKIDCSNIKTVSREHIRVERKGNEWFIEDLGSLNGTFLNDKKCEEYKQYRIKGGDRISLAGDLLIDVEKGGY
ncbi:MAG: FHA domain-containing protein [candidate division WOR-3 bacterium]